MEQLIEYGAAEIAGLLLGVNALAYGAFVFDKHAAQGARRRIRESDLLLLVIFGGAIGAMSAMHLHRRKTKKQLFSLGVPLILTGQLLCGAYIWLQGGLNF